MNSWDPPFIHFRLLKITGFAPAKCRLLGEESQRFLSFKEHLELLETRVVKNGEAGNSHITFWWSDVTIWLFNVAMENHHFLIGKPSISMDHLYHGEVFVITRG